VRTMGAGLVLLLFPVTSNAQPKAKNRESAQGVEN